MILNEEIRKLNTGVARVGHVDLRGLGLASPTTTLEKATTLLSWLRPHLTEEGSVECDALINIKVLQGCSYPRLAGWGVIT